METSHGIFQTQSLFKMYLGKGGEEQGDKKGTRKLNRLRSHLGHQNASLICPVQAKWSYGEITERGAEIPALRFLF